MSRVVAKHSPGEREDGEAERLVRPAPKKKPPRHDRRREDMHVDQDPDPDLKSKDRSLNYKTIGGSLVERVLVRYAAKGGRIGRIPARSKETGKVVFITEKSLRENPDKYEKYKPEKEAPSGAAVGAPDGNAEKPKPPRPRPKPQPVVPTGENPAGENPAVPAPAISGDPAPPGAEPKKKRQKAKKGLPKEPEDAKEPGDEPEKQDESEKQDEPKPVAEEHGIQAPKRREATAAERAEAELLIADHLPPDLAAKLIASGIHPDDAKELLGSYRAAKSRPTGNLSAFASKTAELYETDPDRVQPPKTWRDADGKKVAFDELSPEEQSTAYRQHQMQVVAMSLAAQHQIEEKLTFEGSVTPAVAKVLTRAMLGKLNDTAVPQLSEKVFEATASAKDFVKIPEGSAKRMLDSVEGNEGARSLLQSYLQANDYKRAKALYLNDKISERDKPKKIVEGLRAARDFFKVQARAYGGDEGHDGAKRFETKTLAQLRDLDPEKYKVVRRALDEDHAQEYRVAKRQYNRDLSAFKRAHKAWQKNPFMGVEPTAPKEPKEPIGSSNAKNSDELADEGRKLMEALQERYSTTKTAACVASKFLISSYLSGIPMHRTSNTRAKEALYHGIPPEAHYSRDPYPKWGPVPTRGLSESDFAAILASAKAWLSTPAATHGVEGMVPDQKFRQALDLALSSGLYKPDVQTYNDLLARLQGVPASGLEQSLLTKRADVERGRLERAVYAKFPPDSKRKAAGKLTVMLTGSTASKLRRPDFSTVALADLPLPELQTLARTMHLVTSSFDSGQSDRSRGPAREFRKSDNGVRQMLRLSTEQKTSANQILASFDQLAQSIQDNYRKWGMPQEAAKDLVNRLDRTADATEAVFFGEDSLRTRQAEIALESESFVKDALDEGLLTRAHLSKAARVIQRDSDEGYMDTFKNPMAPIETDSDEPYMSAYGDDQSSSVTDGEDDTGRDLAPEA